MKKIWLKGVSFWVTEDHFNQLRDSKKDKGLPMKEDEAYGLVCKWYPEQSPEETAKKKVKADKEE